MSSRTRAVMILPLCLLYLNVFQEIVLYKLRSLVHDPYLLTALLLLIFAVGFAVVGKLLAPWLEGLFETGHKASRKTGGGGGVTGFYLAMLAVVYAIYFIVYTRGPQHLLPPEWR